MSSSQMSNYYSNSGGVGRYYLTKECDAYNGSCLGWSRSSCFGIFLHPTDAPSTVRYLIFASMPLWPQIITCIIFYDPYLHKEQNLQSHHDLPALSSPVPFRFFFLIYFSKFKCVGKSFPPFFTYLFIYFIAYMLYVPVKPLHYQTNTTAK